MFRFRDRWQDSLADLFTRRNEPTATDRLLALLEDRDRDLETHLDTFIVPEWEPLVLASPWVDYGGTWLGAAIRRVGDVVQVRGLIAGGTSGSAIATLPAGYRPAGDLPPAASAVDVGAGNQFARLDVYMSGSIVAYFPAGTAAYLSIDRSFSVT